MKIDNRQKLLGTLAIGFVVLWAANQIVLAPLYTFWKSRNTQIDRLKKSVADGNVTLRRQTFTREQWRNWSGHAFDKNDPAAEAQLAQEFYLWKTRSNIQVNSTRTTWRKGDDDSYRTMECKADATGTLDAVAHFLYEIENDPWDVKVSSLHITSKDNSGQQLTLTVELSCLQLTDKKSQPQQPQQRNL